MTQILTAKDARKWIRQHFTRKWTVWIHISVGAFCGVLFHWYPGLAALLFGAFGWFEWWQAKVEGDEGHLDFWDGIVGLFTGAGVLWLANLVGVVS